MKLEIQLLAWDRHKIVAGLNLSWNWTCYGNTYIEKKTTKRLHRFVLTQKEHTLTQQQQMNEMVSTIAGLMNAGS